MNRAPEAPPPPIEPSRRAAYAGLAGFSIAVACALIRATVSSEPFPHWEGDPTIIYSPVTALGPTAGLALDVLTLLGCALALLRVQIHRTGAAWFTLLAIILGAGAVFFHGLIRAGGSLDHLRIGSTWLAAIVTGATAHQVCRDPQARRIALGAAFGLIAILALKGIGQVLFEHPQTVALYRENRDQFLAAQGWSPDSPSALAYERRLMQNESTGWFGLSNVYASLAACCTVGLVGLGLRVAARKHAPGPAILAAWVPPTIALGGLLALTALCLAASKGGSVAAGLGIALLTAFSIARRRAVPWLTPRLGSIVSTAVVALSLLAVAARGLIGERLAELSLYFRWFYMQGAARIIAEHPVAGVGPAGFKDAYMLFKPALSPEEVTSPHSLLLDLASTLGIAGLCLGLLWLTWVWSVGAALVEPPADRDPEPSPAATFVPLLSSRQEVQVLFLIACAPTLVGAYVESQAATVEGALVRFFGLIGAAVLSAAVAAAIRIEPGLRSCLAAGAIALAAHSQIEVTPVTPGAACWFMLVFGALAARPPLWVETPAPSKPARVSPALTAALPAAIALIAVTITISGLVPAWRWESRLQAGADAVRPAAELRERVSALADPRSTRDSLTDVAGELSGWLGRLVKPTFEDVNKALRQLQTGGAEEALEELLKAGRVWPTHADTLRAASRLALQIADSHRLQGDPARASEYADRAEKIALDAAALPVGAAASNAWLATVRAARADWSGDPQALERAVLAWQSAARLDPRGVSAPFKIAEACHRLGKTDDARAWAKRALELNLDTRLDPLKGLSEAQKAALTAIAR